jgi:hypothetical protein
MTTSSDNPAASAHLLPRASVSSNPDDTEKGLLPPNNETYRDEPNTPRMRSPTRSPAYPRRSLSLCARALSVAPWIVIGMVLAWMMSALFFQVKPFKADITILKERPQGKEPEPTHNDTLPQEPMPVIVTDKAGNTRWTVSLPAMLEYPLTPDQYEDLCQKTHMVSHHLDDEVHNGPGHYSYYHLDEKFMEMADAEEEGLLPTNPVLKYSSHWSSNYDAGDARTDSAGYCKRSLTYVLETESAGLGPMLMEMWTAYGLAMQEDRAFFIDDRNWAYGKYTDYFQPPPDPRCLPPPDNHLLPCPRHTSHLVASHGTQGRMFGHGFTEEYEDPKKMRVERQVNIFGLMRDGYEALYHLADADQEFLEKRIKVINSTVREKGGVEVGVHVRHGDRHPLEFEYSKTYIPLNRYIDEAWEAAESAHEEAESTHEETSSRRNAVFNDLQASKMIVASDDPLVYWSDDMALAMPAQELINLGEEPPLDPTSSDEDSPWEGGFTAETFWLLGAPAKSKAPSKKPSRRPKYQGRYLHKPEHRDLQDGRRVPPTQEALKLRSHVARSYLLDLAIIGQTDRVVCTVSSVGCRLLAVMMGWERAIEQEHWINIDGQWDWSGIRW